MTSDPTGQRTAGSRRPDPATGQRLGQGSASDPTGQSRRRSVAIGVPQAPAAPQPGLDGLIELITLLMGRM